LAPRIANRWPSVFCSPTNRQMVAMSRFALVGRAVFVPVRAGSSVVVNFTLLIDLNVAAERAALRKWAQSDHARNSCGRPENRESSNELWALPKAR
jgi:hypothetical protein